MRQLLFPLLAIGFVFGCKDKEKPKNYKWVIIVGYDTFPADSVVTIKFRVGEVSVSHHDDSVNKINYTTFYNVAAIYLRNDTVDFTKKGWRQWIDGDSAIIAEHPRHLERGDILFLTDTLKILIK